MWQLWQHGSTSSTVPLSTRQSDLTVWPDRSPLLNLTIDTYFPDIDLIHTVLYSICPWDAPHTLTWHTDLTLWADRSPLILVWSGWVRDNNNTNSSVISKANCCRYLPSAYFPELRTLQWLSGCSLSLSFHTFHCISSTPNSEQTVFAIGQLDVQPVNNLHLTNKIQYFYNQHFSQGSRYVLLLAHCSVVHSDKNTFCIRWNNSQSILCILFNPKTRGGGGGGGGGGGNHVSTWLYQNVTNLASFFFQWPPKGGLCPDGRPKL